MSNANLQAVTDAGVSIWLVDLDRTRISSGNLASLIADKCVRGVTTNPSIFQKAITSGDAYKDQLLALASQGADVDSIIRSLTTDDVRAACDIFLPLYHDSNGVDGRVSIEVDPRLAHETVTTVEQAKELHGIVDRANVLIKIPATPAGLPAITEVIAAGISVNVTLIFSVSVYIDVVNAYMAGLEKAAASGADLSTIHSVASFFVSRIDTEVDARLNEILTPAAAHLMGRAAIANARLAWQAHLDILNSDRWKALAAKGANPQRPLWASTGVKDPAYDPTRYVIDLVVDGCVNTMPEGTLNAVASQGVCQGDLVTGTAHDSAQVWKGLADIGIDQVEVCSKLEAEGVAKFVEAWIELRQSVAATAGIGA